MLLPIISGCPFLWICTNAIQRYLAWPSLIHSNNYLYIHKSKKKSLLLLPAWPQPQPWSMNFHQPPRPVSHGVRPAVGIEVRCRPLVCCVFQFRDFRRRRYFGNILLAWKHWSVGTTFSFQGLTRALEGVQNYAYWKRGGGRIFPPANSSTMKARITKFLWKLVWLRISIV